MSQSSGGAPAPEGSLRAAVETVPAGRRGQGRRYPLGGVLALAVCAQLGGCRSLYAIGQWGQDGGSALRVALGLSGRRGPSVATRHRVFRDLDHAAYERVLGAWRRAGAGGGRAPGGRWEDAAREPRRGDPGRASGGGLCPTHAGGGSAEAQTRGKGHEGHEGHELAGVKAALAALPERVLRGRVVTGDALLAQRERCRLIVAHNGGISSC